MVNNTTVKSAPKGAIDQLGECLSRIVHAFAEASNDAKIFMAKRALKDGFWQMDCRKGKEWIFCMYYDTDNARCTYIAPNGLG